MDRKEVNNYDVIIVGAGPAGGQCARYLVKNSNYSVLLIDKTHKIGLPNKSTAGTPYKTLKEFQLPSNIVMSITKNFILESKNENAILPVKGCVLNFEKLKQFLVKDAKNNGLNVKIKSTVSNGTYKNEKIIGLEYKTKNKKHFVTGKIIIDASGPSSVLADKMGAKIHNKEDLWTGIEFEMTNLKLEKQNSMLIRFDKILAPFGYAWIFSTGINKAKVGVCWNTEQFRKTYKNGTQMSFLKKWIRNDRRLRSGVRHELHGGIAYLNDAKKRYEDNFMAIGDSISSINPIFGEGIRQAMQSGVIAAKTAIGALNMNDTSKRIMKKYDKLWRKSIGKNRLIHHRINKKLYSLSEKGYDFMIKKFRDLDKKTICKIINYEVSLSYIKLLF